MILLPKEMIVALTLIFGLTCLMIFRTIWLLRQERIEDKLKWEYMVYVANGNGPKWEYEYWLLHKAKKGVSYFKYPLTMSISERLRRKNRHFKW